MITSILTVAMAVAEPDNNAIRNQAARCGLDSSEVIWAVDFRGQRSAIVRLVNFDEGSFEKLTCLLDWGKQSGVSLGYVSDNPPSSTEIAVLKEVSQHCGLPDGVFSFQLNGLGGYDIRISRTTPVSEDLIGCALARLPSDFDMRFGVGPVVATLPNNQTRN